MKKRFSVILLMMHLYSINVDHLLLPRFSSMALAADNIEIQFIHTNDLHSHFRPSNIRPHLGGYARLKTAIEGFRKENKNTLVLDGGDWSEGTIYYTDGVGLQSALLLEQIGVDISVIGNHEWLNGPDHLVNMLLAAQSFGPRITFLGANVDLERFSKAADFQKVILPYVLREIEGIRFAFVGILNTEKIYNSFFLPVELKSPKKTIKRLLKELKNNSDFVVVISHNNTSENEKLLKDIHEIDLVIGGHDHVYYPQPVTLKRKDGRHGWVFNSGFWGQHLGRIHIEVTPKKELQLKQYDSIPIDSSFLEDPKINQQIAKIEKKIATNIGGGPIFEDAVAHSEIQVTSEGVESLLGDLVTDSYLNATGVDASIDNVNFMYSGLGQGIINISDVFNVLAAVYSPLRKESWHLNIISLKGRKFFWFLNLLLSFSEYRENGLLHTSGMELVYKHPDIPGGTRSLDPWEDYFNLPEGFEMLDPHLQSRLREGPVHSLKIRGQWIDLDKTYRFAVGGGIVEVFQYVNSLVPNFFPLDKLVDVGSESWRVLLEYLKQIKNVNFDTLNHGYRVRTFEPDLGVREESLKYLVVAENAYSITFDVQLSVTNYGLKFSPGKGEAVKLFIVRGGNQAENCQEIDLPKKIPSLSSQQSTLIQWKNIILPKPVLKGTNIIGFKARVMDNKSEINHTNDEITTWVKELKVPH